MMFGSDQVSAMKLGTDDVSAVYLGSDLAWAKTSIYQTFDVADTDNLTALGWVSHGGAGSYDIGVVSGTARVAVPSGFGSGFVGLNTDRVRYADHVAPGDNGYIQFRVATVGASDSVSSDKYVTQVFGRGSNAAATDGAGVQLQNSILRIVRRAASTDTVVKEAGSFAAGDILRLTFVGDLYTLTRNGAFAAEWEDTGSTVSVGSGFRSLLMRMDGTKELTNTRYFSPAIDYVEYG